MSALAEELLTGLTEHLACGRLRVAVIGLTAEGLTVVAAAASRGGEAAIFEPGAPIKSHPWAKPWSELASFEPEVVVVAADREKEQLLRAAADVLDGAVPLPHVVLAGLGHQDVIDPLYEDLEAPALVPSYATGHPHTRVHLYNCLRAAA